MKKFFRYLGIFLLTIILLIGLVVAVVYAVFPPKKVITKVQAEVKKNTGRDVEIGGANLTFRKGLAFKLNDLSVDNPTGFDGKNLLELKSLTLKVQLKPLLQKKLLVDDITLEDLKLNLEVNADSTNNFTFEAAEKKQKTSTEGDTLVAEKKAPILPISISLPFNLKNGNISFTNRMTNQVFRFQEINSNSLIKADKETQNLDVFFELFIPKGELLQQDKSLMPFSIFPVEIKSDLALALKDQNYDTKLDVLLGQLNPAITSSGKWSDNTAELSSLEIALGNTVVTVKSQITNLKTPEGNYQITLKSDLNDLIQQIPLEIPIKSLTGQIDGKFSGDIKTDEASLAEISALLPQGSLDFSNINLQVDETMPKVENVGGSVVLADKKINIKDVGASIGQSHVGLNASTDLSNFKTPEDVENLMINYAITGNIDLAEIKQHAPAEFPVESLSGKINLNINDAIKLPNPQAIDFSKLIPSGDVTLTNIKVKMNDTIPEIQKLDGSVVLTGSGIKLQNTTAKVNGNTMNLSGNVDLSKFKTEADIDKINVNVALNSNKIDLNTIVPPPAKKEGQKEAPGEETKEIVLPPLPPMPAITGQADVKTLLYDKYTMQNVNGKFSVKNSVIKLENLDMDVFSGKVSMNSTFNLADTTYAMQVKVDKTQANDFFTSTFEPLRDRIFGTLSFNADVNGSGLNPEEIKQNLISNGDFLLSDGKVMNFDFLQKASNVVKVFSFDEIDFNKSKSLFEIRDNKFYTDQLKMDTKDANYDVSGYTTLDGEMNYTARTFLSKSISDKINMPQKDLFLNDDGRFIIDLNITGKGKGSRVAWDKSFVEQRAKEKVQEKVDETKQELQKKADEKLEETKEEIEDKAKDAFKKLFGN